VCFVRVVVQWVSDIVRVFPEGVEAI